jgi:predicted TIM-barrel fold metal-dependent hydrolase
MIIDWQHHFSPEEIYKKRGGKPGQPVIKDGKVGLHLYPEVHQIGKHIEFMDAAGIDVAVLSATLDSVEDCKLTIQLYSKVIREHPKRFVCLAPCIPTRGKEALQEMERAINLGCKGVVISPQNDGEPLDSRKLWPFYEKVSHLKIPIFVHITNIPVGYTALDAPYNLNVSMTREFDLAASTARLILGGVIVEFPDIKFVMSHLGGGISSIMERIERYVDAWGERFWTELGGKPPFELPHKENFRKYFSKLYFDLAGYEGGMNAIKCALTTISPQKMVFATDYPYNFTNDPQGVRRYIENIRKLDLPSKSIEGMLGGNAAKLLGWAI